VALACNTASSRADKAFLLLKTTGQAVDIDLANVNHTQAPDPTTQLAAFRTQYQGDAMVVASAEALDLLATRIASAEAYSLESRLQGQLETYQRALDVFPPPFRTSESTAKIRAAIAQVEIQMPEAKRQTQLLEEARAKVAKAQSEMAALLPKG
jgi:hypothetical protein